MGGYLRSRIYANSFDKTCMPEIFSCLLCPFIPKWINKVHHLFKQEPHLPVKGLGEAPCKCPK